MMYTTPYDFGDIVVVWFPFTNLTATKQRPAVVASSQGYNTVNRDVILMAVTSQLHRQGVYGEILIADWEAANLLKPSAIKPVVVTMQKSLLLQTLGKLQVADKFALRTMLQTIFG